MSELPSVADMKETQAIIAAAPHGPWEITPPGDERLPDQVGPICFMETWVDSERIPVMAFIEHAREALPRYMGAYARQLDRVRELEAHVRRLENANGGVRHG
ncbi:hypothetical protein ACIP4S_13365 [Streptomyces chartreusis]|uniref:hypothetical protein n=1 Tax=Streptomyces chartreusis TaxID=1969 RepID=UPI00382AFC89